MSTLRRQGDRLSDSLHKQSEKFDLSHSVVLTKISAMESSFGARLDELESKNDREIAALKAQL